MDLMHVLKRFNRKERFHLLRHVLGCEGESFRLSAGFREALGANIGQRVPEDALVVMDYHLDWIAMAVWLAERDGIPTKAAPERNEAQVQGNQEDVDLLVAFKAAGTSHLVLVEAKGDASWDNAQLESKAERLRAIFGEEIADGAKVRPHFVLLAPRESSRIRNRAWPVWMRTAVARQMALPWPLTMKPTLCDERGDARRGGPYIRVDAKASS